MSVWVFWLCSAVSRLISQWPKIILEVDNEGDLPIHQACRQGNRDIVAVLLQQEQPQKDIKLIQLARLSLDLKYWSVAQQLCKLVLSEQTKYSVSAQYGVCWLTMDC